MYQQNIKEKPYDHLSRCKKRTSDSSTLIYEQMWNNLERRRNLMLLMASFKNLQLSSYLVMKDWRQRYYFSHFRLALTAFPSQCNKARKRNKRYSEWKGGSKSILCTGNTVTYLENIKKSPNKFLELINGKVARQRSKFKIVFFYTILMSN